MNDLPPPPFWFPKLLTIIGGPTDRTVDEALCWVEYLALRLAEDTRPPNWMADLIAALGCGPVTIEIAVAEVRKLVAMRNDSVDRNIALWEAEDDIARRWGLLHSAENAADVKRLQDEVERLRLELFNLRIGAPCPNSTG